MTEDPPEITGLVFEEELGHGAHSVVYRARHGDVPCAVKIARRGGRQGRWFRREAAALARVRHRGVPRVLEVGEVGDRPYLAMELVRGQTLAARLRRGRLPSREGLELAIDLADIVAAIHDRGLVHRDIKPRNIIVGTDGVLRLVDFGLATQLFPLADGSAVGTRSYAAPEQFDAPHLVDGRADLYAIGRVLEEAVELEGSDRLREVVRGLTEPSLDDRYPTARALAIDLRRAQLGAAPHGPRAVRVPEGASVSPIVGRSEELRRLALAWESARQGRGGVVLVEGRPGAGKTRLLDELVAQISGIHTCLRAGGGSPVPLAPVRRLLDAYLDRVDQSNPAARREWEGHLRESVAAHGAADVATVSERIARVLGDIEPSREPDPEALAENIARVFVGLADRVGALLIVVDDLQWLDPLSREVLVRVALSTDDAPILLIAAARSDARSLPPLQRFGRALGPERLSVLSVRPLVDGRLARLIAAYLGEDDVDPALVQRIAGLCDGTPLSALDMVAALVDRGALRPHWGHWAFDAVVSHQIELPPGSVAHLTRRLRDTPEATVRVLRVAAVMGSGFDPSVVARVIGVRDEDIRLALMEASRAGVVDLGHGNRPRFVHDTLREALVEGMTDADRRAAHRDVARVLTRTHRAEGNLLFAIADHLGKGRPFEDAAEAYDIARRAAERAAALADHETALECFALAEAAASEASVPIDLAFLRAHAESRIAVGALEEGLASLERALGFARGLDRGGVLARLAWVYAALGDASSAWDALDRAFATAGATLPRERPASLMHTLVDTGRLATRLTGPQVVDPHERRRLETLCDLHYQNARLGLDLGKSLRVVASSVMALRMARQLGPSPQLVRAEASYGAFITVLGRTEAGARHIAQAEARARALGDASLIAITLQNSIVANYWAGRTLRATERTGELLDGYGAWLDVTEYCLLVLSARCIESLRGRERESLAWLERAIDRIRRHGRLPAVFRRAIVPLLHATLVTLGREHEEEFILAGLDFAAETRESAIFRLVTWGPRALTLLSTGKLGRELDALVAEFATLRQDPKRAHLVLGEYYYCVAYARAAQCEAAVGAECKLRLRQLDAAIADFRKASRVDAFRAHLRALEGDRARLVGDFPRARTLLGKARELAERELAPWVLFEVARAEARILRAEGLHEAARDRARVAAVHVHAHGTVRRLHQILEEFDIEPFVSTMGSAHGSSRSSERSHSQRSLQLRALVKVVHAAAPQGGVQPQARAVLDEMLRVVGVERGILLFERAEPEGVRVLTARTRDGDDWDPSGEGYPRLLKQVSDQGKPMGPGDDERPRESSSGPFDTSRMIAVPLFVQSELVGALVLQRGAHEARFVARDVELVAALAPQVSLALEAARLLEERERLQDTLRQAQKMEGVGQLASGIAHDFNNMLTAIMSSLDTLGHHGTLDPAQARAIDVVRDSTERASQLTRQLLAFSRRQVLDMKVVDVGAAIEGVLPMLQRMLGGEVFVESRIAPGVPCVLTDRPSLENMIVNLAVNARDAMPEGGHLGIHVDTVDVDEALVAQGASRTGLHLRIRVRDTGTGMPPEVLAKVFEPFFTTKPVGSGTGLGLASSYGFIKQCGGHIEVDSEVGRGTTFTIILPASDARPPEVSPAPPRPRALQRGRTATVLVVEDEGLVRRATEAILEREGIEVCFAEQGEEALAVVCSGARVDLVITDVQMPTMDGPTFVRRMVEAGYTIPVLLVSGYADPAVIGDLDPPMAVEFLAKPYSRDELVSRVRDLLHATAEEAGE